MHLGRLHRRQWNAKTLLSIKVATTTTMRVLLSLSKLQQDPSHYTLDERQSRICCGEETQCYPEANE